MVCAPGLAHQRLTPENCNELLFDDVIWLQQARRDHFDFVAKMVDRGVEVLELQDLLADVVAMPEARDWVLDRKVTDDLVGPGLTHEIRAWLTELPPDRLAEFLIGGVAYQDVPDEVGGGFLSAFRELDPAGFVLRPLPNTQFMRDNTAWIFGGVTLNPMYWPARRQETLLTTAVYKFHPAFADEKFDIWLGDAEGVARDHGVATLEGGDVMPIGKGRRGDRHGRALVASGDHPGGAQPVRGRGRRAGDHRQPAEVPRRNAPGHRVHLLRPRPGHGVRAGRRRDRAVQPAARRQLPVRSGHPARAEGVDRPPSARPSAWTSGWSPPPATSTASSASSGTTATTWSRSNPAWSSATTATSSPTRHCARPESRSSPSPPASWAGAAAAAAA